MLKKIKAIIKSRIKNIVLEELEKNNLEVKDTINKSLEVIGNKQEENYKDLLSKYDQTKSNIENFNSYFDDIRELNEKINKTNEFIDDVKKSIEALKSRDLADESDFKAFYNLLLKRDPEEGAVRTGKVLRNELFNSIIFSEEYEMLNKIKHNKNSDVLWDKPTYSQSGEDSILFYIFKMLNIQYQDITYLDLGANHARDLSNTYFFYERGASGVLVDANPKLCEILRRERERDIVINKCVSSDSGQTIDFYILNGDGLSSMDRSSVNDAIAKNPQLKIEEIIKIKSICVNDILKQHFSHRAPTILNIDIEGYEIEILNSIDFKRYKPLIIICEMIPYDTSLVVGTKNTEIIDFMKEKGYVEYAFTGINSIFIQKDWRYIDEKKNSIS